MLSTRLTELLGIDHPVVLPGMSWISKAELVAAVSEAGGLGILATGPLQPDETREAIAQVRKRTSRPFGVGITLMMPGALPNAQVALEEQVPVVNFQLGKGEWLVKGVHSYGGKAIATVISEKHARSAEAVGVDALLVTGYEAAAHGSDVSSLVLLPALARAVNVPLIAAGGFANGAGLLAALSLGASGIAMGTRFAATQQSALHPDAKQAITEKTQDETIRSKNFDGMMARVMKTPTSLRLTRRPMSFPETAVRAIRSARKLGMPVRQVLRALVTQLDRVRLLSYFGAALDKVEIATIRGDVENGVQFIGQAQGLVHDVPNAGDLVRRVVAEAEELLENLSKHSSPRGG